MRARFLTVGVSCYKFKKGEYCVVGLELEVSQYELEVLICMQMDRHKNRYRVYECVFPFLWLSICMHIKTSSSYCDTSNSSPTTQYSPFLNLVV